MVAIGTQNLTTFFPNFKSSTSPLQCLKSCNMGKKQSMFLISSMIEISFGSKQKLRLSSWFLLYVITLSS